MVAEVAYVGLAALAVFLSALAALNNPRKAWEAGLIGGIVTAAFLHFATVGVK